ncbi:MAG: hypothetical protein WKF83_09125 [Nocardioidaceae bacterium]
MRDDQRRQRLVDANPWWRAASAGEDPTAWAAHQRILRSRADYDLGYRPDILNDVRTEPVTDLLAVLTGPRRIGKSVALLDTCRSVVRPA